MRNPVLFAVLLAAPAVFGADGIGKVFDDQVSTVEREVLGLAQKMPADKYDFAPTSPGAFTGVRTYALQVRHIATYIYRIAASVSGEKAPVEIGPTDNGPDTLKTKDQIIDYFKGALAFAHKAMGTLNEKNMYDQVPSPFGRGTMTRVAAAAFLGQHSYDHYGQMVVYSRMNGVIPGGGPPPADGKGKGNRVLSVLVHMCYSTRVTEFTLTLEPGASISDQAVYAAKKALVSGQIRPGEPFPSVRSLSQTLKINPNTAHKVIARLTAEGLLEVKPGIGTVVAVSAPENTSGRNHLLKNELERIVVEAKRAGLKLEDLTAALSYHWTRLSPAA